MLPVSRVSLFAISRGLLVAALLLVGSTAQANPVAVENGKPGTLDWSPNRAARNHEIEGYASHTSINRGDQIRFFVSTDDPSFTFEVFRMGWYGGAGARRMTSRIELPGIKQTTPPPDPVTGLIECNWVTSHMLVIPDNPSDPTDWLSGVYLAKLISGVSKRESYIIFVVRDDDRVSDYLFLSTVTTFQAYNAWGGRSLYSSPVAHKVSFNRPYDIFQGNGTGKFLNNEGWEYNMVRWLEREGYDVTYGTNIDTHSNRDLLLSHKAFLSVGHDEYWSYEMRESVTAARDRGINLAFFSANSVYWQIRLEPSSIDGQPNRTMVCYKRVDLDPVNNDADRSNDHLTTVQWRQLPVNRPEDALLGVMYTYHPVDSDIVIEKADHWIFQGTGLKPGDRLPGLLGYEVDRMFGNAPFTIERLAHSPFQKADGSVEYSDMTIYRAPSGAMVFAAGTIRWSFGLDDYNAPDSRASRLSPAAQQITRNVLARFAGRAPSRRQRLVRR